MEEAGEEAEERRGEEEAEVEVEEVEVVVGDSSAWPTASLEALTAHLEFPGSCCLH